MKAGERALELARRAGEDDLVVAPISGGGSALLERPVEAIGLESLRQTTELLLASGEPIQRINAVRKHLSAIKGGQLARALSPARCVTLLVSDVVGDRLDTIASGPTAPDETTYSEALEVLEEAELSGRIPDDVFDHLQAGARGEHPETPDEGDPVFDDAIFEIVASRREALEAIEESARSEGYRTEVFTTEMAGEAREVAREIVARLDSLVRELDSDDTPVCLLACGETTVTVTGSGRGGRNQELALAAAIEMERRDLSGETLGLAALATDGIDGPTDAAGAIVDASTIERGRDVGLDALDHLERNDSYAYLDAVGELVRTGPTGTNVNDLVVGIVQPEEAG